VNVSVCVRERVYVNVCVCERERVCVNECVGLYENADVCM
jgi:hypothetical protein